MSFGKLWKKVLNNQFFSVPFIETKIELKYLLNRISNYTFIRLFVKQNQVSFIRYCNKFREILK